MIKKTHPADRAERRRLTEHYEKKKFKGAAKKVAAIRDEETKDDLNSYRSGYISVD
jgi:hypothetical protein